MEEAKDGQVFCGDRSVPREQFVTWPQVREMVASGLVEVASHSYSLHKGVTSNPQGSMPPPQLPIFIMHKSNVMKMMPITTRASAPTCREILP